MTLEPLKAEPRSGTIRRATLSDIPGIQRVARLSWRKTYSPFVSAADLDHVIELLYSHDRLSNDRPGLVRIVAEVEGEVVGYAFAGRDPDRSIHLYAIYVLPEHQRHGLGTQLMWAALDPFASDGAAEAYIGVYPANHAARRFYEHHGARLEEGMVDRLEVAGVTLDEVTYRVPLPLP
jgi:ribosomal protein S18 acetylase RimI-like enzyme